MSTPTSEHFHESNLIEGYDDPAFDEAIAGAWATIVDARRLGDTAIEQVQKQVVREQVDLSDSERGHYRRRGVWVGGVAGLDWRQIDTAMKGLIVKLNDPTAYDPWTLHVEFERIHPFIDGNGRTGRLLLWWHQMQRSEDPSLILNATKHRDYYPIFANGI